MSPLLIWLLAIPGAFLFLPLLSVATGLVCTHLMPGVSRALRPADRLRLRRGGGGPDVLPSRHPAIGGSAIRG